MVYVTDGETTVGVPLISPVVASKVKPVGRAGETDHEVTVPPPTVGVTDVIATSFVKTNELGLKVTPDGGASLTKMVTLAVELPPEFVAVTV